MKYLKSLKKQLHKNKIGKKAITVEAQIQKLISRCMVMDLGEEKAKEILLDIGYYRLGFYWNPFEIDENHNLQPNTKFSINNFIYKKYMCTQ